jgi:hypothetical protein
MLSSLGCLAACPGAHIDKVDALFVAQLSGRELQVAQRNLRYKIRLEWITHVERATHRLTAIGRIWQLVLFMGDVQHRIFGIGPYPCASRPWLKNVPTTFRVPDAADRSMIAIWLDATPPGPPSSSAEMCKQLFHLSFQRTQHDLGRAILPNGTASSSSGSARTDHAERESASL